MTTNPTPTDETDDRVLQRTAAHLAERYDGIFSPDLVERIVYESYTTLHRTARIKTYVASLAGNFAESRLRSLAYSKGLLRRPLPQVLFVCAENAGRSQLAAAALAGIAGDRVEVRSAGARPGEDVYPEVVELLRERGLDAEHAYPKPLTDDVLRGADYIVSMRSGDEIIRYPGKTYLEWDIPVRAEVSAANVGSVFEEVERHVAELWSTIEAKVAEDEPDLPQPLEPA